jgi:hypothetical protein
MPLDESEKSRLRTLEERLQACVKSGSVETAIEITSEIQILFADDRKNFRLLRAKLWCFEAALLANRVDYAEAGLVGVMQLSGTATKLRLEAQVLLTICYLRQKNLPQAKQTIRLILKNADNIQSERSRILFQRKFIARLEEECVLAQLIGTQEGELDVEQIHQKAVYLIQNNNEDEILSLIGNSLPNETRNALIEVKHYALLQLNPSDSKSHGEASDINQPSKLGARAFAVLKRIAWQSFCAPDSAVYSLWSKKVPKVFGSGYMAASLIAAFKDWRIGMPLLASGVLATIMKYSAHEFCNLAKPETFMTAKKEINKAPKVKNRR